MAIEQIKYKHPLAEVFGFPTKNHSAEAVAHRQHRLCPFNNNSLKCTKDKKSNPLGVCSMFHNGKITIICPIRFRENWRICSDAGHFFFEAGVKWTILKEIRLKDKDGNSAGNIDIILAVHNKKGKVLDFGAIEVQSVYVSGNIRKPFEVFMTDPVKNDQMNWSNKPHYPRPDYLSSSRKRLIPQLMYKGLILRSWRKKQAVIIDRSFYETIPIKPSSNNRLADLCWFVYEHSLSQETNKFEIKLFKKIYEDFEDSMKRIATPKAGNIDTFIADLEKKLAIEMEYLRKNYGAWAFSQLLERESFDQEDAHLICDL